ncbi:uncharacterized protein [Panulirus ornatus]|uniref:uncharacterized protein isoform X3 n=1 Tax=Panulirus ornatus TaxID=150431 RepID=UPI003A888B15
MDPGPSWQGLREEQAKCTLGKGKRTLDDIDEVSAKRRKLHEQGQSRREDNLGYRKDQEVPFIWMLYNRRFYESVPPDHILNKAPKGDAGIYMLVEDILSMNTGINLQDITADTVLCLPELTSIIKKIIKNYRSLSLQHLVSAYCQHDTHSRSETSPDTCKITVDDIAVLLRCAPPEADDDNHHQEALLQLELQSVRNKPLEDVPPLGWKQVFALTLAVLRRVIPSEVWGSAHNLCVMKRAIKNILMLGRFDKLYLGNLLGNIKTNCCSKVAPEIKRTKLQRKAGGFKFTQLGKEKNDG